MRQCNICFKEDSVLIRICKKCNESNVKYYHSKCIDKYVEEYPDNIQCNECKDPYNIIRLRSTNICIISLSLSLSILVADIILLIMFKQNFHKETASVIIDVLAIISFLNVFILLCCKKQRHVLSKRPTPSQLEMGEK